MKRGRREGENHTLQILNEEIKQLCNKLLARHPRQRHAEKIRSLIRCHAEICLPAEICMYVKMTLMFQTWSVRKQRVCSHLTVRFDLKCRSVGVKLSVSSQKYKAAGILYTSDWTQNVWSIVLLSWFRQATRAFLDSVKMTVAEKCTHHSYYYFVEVKV